MMFNNSPLITVLYNPQSIITCTRCKKASAVSYFTSQTTGLSRPKTFLIDTMSLCLLTFFAQSLLETYSYGELSFRLKVFLTPGLKCSSLTHFRFIASEQRNNHLFSFQQTQSGDDHDLPLSFQKCKPILFPVLPSKVFISRSLSFLVPFWTFTC